MNAPARPGPRRERPLTTPSPDVEFCIVGSGFAGLGMAIRLKQRRRHSFVILEKAAAIGGTWRENRYPGCACDVPAHLYSFSFEQNPNWSRLFAPREEIHRYLEHCVDKYALRPHLRLETEVQRVEYDERAGLWRVFSAGGATLSCRFLVLAVGALNRPAYPNIPGIERFRGRAIHSAEWDPRCDLTGQRVAVVGTGASAIQLIPRLAASVRALSVFQRTPPWVLPKPDREMGAREQRLFRLFPALQRIYRWWIYWAFELRCLGFTVNPRLMRLLSRLGVRHIHRQIKDPELRRAVTPDYMPGCKRILMANDYYPALTRPNVALITQRISQVTERGIATADGVEHELDTIVYGTGFRVTDFLTPLSIVGRKGLDLNTAWKDGGEAYLGTLLAEFPNLFMLLGPNTGLGHNSMVFMMEAQIEFALRCVSALERRGAKALQISGDAQRAFNRALQPRLLRSVWASGCRSWYLDAHGRNSTLWPGFTFEFWLRTRRVQEDLLQFESGSSESELSQTAVENSAGECGEEAGAPG